MANIITIMRILCSIAILFCPVFSMAFYSLYITAGVSDIADGGVARRTNTASELGAKLDTFVSSLPLQRFRRGTLSEQKDIDKMSPFPIQTCYIGELVQENRSLTLKRKENE